MLYKKPREGFYHKLFTLLMPIVIQNLITSAVSMADVVMLGQVNQTVLSASSLAGQVQFILNILYFGLERSILYADETARRVQAQAQGQVVDSGLDFAGGLGLAADGLGLLASLTNPEPVEDDVWRGSDRKTLAKEFEKKEELGMKM